MFWLGLGMSQVIESPSLETRCMGVRVGLDGVSGLGTSLVSSTWVGWEGVDGDIALSLSFMPLMGSFHIQNFLGGRAGGFWRWGGGNTQPAAPVERCREQRCWKGGDRSCIYSLQDNMSCQATHSSSAQMRPQHFRWDCPQAMDQTRPYPGHFVCCFPARTTHMAQTSSSPSHGDRAVRKGSRLS